MNLTGSELEEVIVCCGHDAIHHGGRCSGQAHKGGDVGGVGGGVAVVDYQGNVLGNLGHIVLCVAGTAGNAGAGAAAHMVRVASWCGVEVHAEPHRRG